MDKLAKQFERDVKARYMQKLAETYDFIKEAKQHVRLTKKDYKFMQGFLKRFPEQAIYKNDSNEIDYKKTFKNIRDTGGLYFHASPKNLIDPMTIDTGAAPERKISRKLRTQSPLGALVDRGYVNVELLEDAKHPITDLPLDFARGRVTPEGVDFGDGKIIPHEQPILPENYTSENGQVKFKINEAPIPFLGTNVDNLFTVGTFSGTDKTQGIPIGNRTQPPLDSKGLIKNPTSPKAKAFGEVLRDSSSTICWGAS